jgi:hypothetical protein
MKVLREKVLGAKGNSVATGRVTEFSLPTGKKTRAGIYFSAHGGVGPENDWTLEELTTLVKLFTDWCTQNHDI